MTKTRNWYTKAIYLVFALVMTLGLLMVPAAAPTTAQVAPTEVCGWFVLDGATADGEWVAGQTYTGDYTPKLTNAVTYVHFVPEGGITVADLDDITASPEWSYWYNLLTGASTHGPELELRFTSAGYDPADPTGAGHVDITVFSGASDFTADAAWHERPVLASSGAAIYYGNDPTDGTAFHSEGEGPWTLGEVLDEINAETAMTANTDTADDWELTRVGLQLYSTHDCYVDEVTLNGTTYDLEPCYSIFPPIAKDVKGSKQEFYILDGGSGERADEGLSFNWSVTPKLNLMGVDPPTAGGDVKIIAGGDGYNYIVIRSLEPGDASLECIVAGVEAVPAEKKWGIIDHTILDLDPETPETPADPDGTVTHVAGTNASPETEEFSDWVYAKFYMEPFPATFVDEAGHAVVHWWLIKNDALGANEAAIDAIMALLGECPEGGTEPCGCGSYADWADGVTPFSEINAVWAADPAEFTTFTDVVEGITAADADPNIDGTFNILNLTYIKTMTENDMVGQTRGLVQVEVSNTGAEDILIVTLTEYPWNYFGENPVCIEKGEKDWPVVPPPPEVCQVKVPQVRWAGEKIVLEKDWETDPDQLVGFFLEEGCVGNLIPFPGDELDPEVTHYIITEDARTAFTVTDAAGIARAMLESEQQGQVDVKCVLYGSGSVVNGLRGMTFAAIVAQTGNGGADELQVIGNHGFLVYYLALENVAVDTDLSDLTAIDAGEDADVLVKVRGWFTSDTLPGTSRGPVLGEDGITYVRPAGRYVLPDDWAALAGSDEATSNLASRPQYDLMNTPGDGVVSTDELGPYGPATGVRTTTPPGVADDPVIGPFNTLQPWNCVDELGNPTNMWIATALVPADLEVAALTTVWDTDDLRNTVVPDTTIDEFDCPMPQALVTFDVDTEVLKKLDKGTVLGYGVDAGGDFIAPFYAMEIPSHWLIPVGGYHWDSWGLWTIPTTDDGPYDFWTDLAITPNDADILEVYSDNHGYAGVTIEGTGLADECVTVDVIADFPVMAAKYPAVETDTEVCWGEALIHLDADFEVSVRSGEAPLTISFYGLRSAGTGLPWTMYGTEPYVKAEWDFDGDGSIDLTVEGATSALTLATQTFEFEHAGTYSPTLTVTDSSATPMVDTCVKPNYIVVSGEASPVTWTCPLGGEPLIAPNPGAGRPALTVAADCDGITVSGGEELWGIYYLVETGPDAGTWLWYVPGYASSTLTELELGELYFLVVSGPCTLTIPQ